MKAKELREMSSEDLRQLEAQLRDELFRAKMRHYSGQIQKPSDLRSKRREIARVQTILNERR